jgi:hypothetical protein
MERQVHWPVAWMLWGRVVSSTLINQRILTFSSSKYPADFAKGNRFFSGKAYEVMPKLRFLGTAFLSLLTKIVSGYWHLSDFQSGYVAISKKALETVDWQQMYKRYGQPNDQLILLNVYNFRVQDVPVDPVYHVGEVSGIKIKKVIFTLGWLLVNRSIREFLSESLETDF